MSEYCLGCSVRDDHVDVLKARIAGLEAAQEWVPVSERVPDNMRLVLATDGEDQEVCYYDAKLQHWWTRLDDITHWRELLELPK